MKKNTKKITPYLPTNILTSAYKAIRKNKGKIDLGITMNVIKANR